MSLIPSCPRVQRIHAANAIARESRLAAMDARLLADTRRCMAVAREGLPALTRRAGRLERSIRLRAEFVERSARWLEASR